MARIPLVAGNWKMNFDHLEATYFVQKLAWLLRDAHFDRRRCQVALMPAFTALRSVQVLVEADNLPIEYGAQAVSVTAQGPSPGTCLLTCWLSWAAATSSWATPSGASTIRRTTPTSSTRSEPSWLLT